MMILSRWKFAYKHKKTSNKLIFSLLRALNVTRVGLEPTTLWLKAKCSAN